MLSTLDKVWILPKIVPELISFVGAWFHDSSLLQTLTEMLDEPLILVLTFYGGSLV